MVATTATAVRGLHATSADDATATDDDRDAVDHKQPVESKVLYHSDDRRRPHLSQVEEIAVAK